MDIIVIGAGVVGVSCAWRLAQDGHRVRILDKASDTATGTSFANGGQLSYSYVAPLADPSVWGQLPKLLTDPDSPVRFRPGFELFQYRWLAQFMAACTPRRAARTIDQLGRLADLSKQVLHGNAALSSLAFDWTQTGKLVVYSSEKSFAAARTYAEQQAANGTDKRALSAEACLSLEPALASIAHRLVGGLYSPGDEAGDTYLFTQGMAKLLEPGSILLGTEVTGFVRDGRTVKAVRTNKGDMEADLFILAAGIASRPLGSMLGLDLPIYPLKGYSATAPIGAEAAVPDFSITDAARKVVYARLGSTLRLAGAADLVGHSLDIDRQRTDKLIADAKTDFPDAADWDQSRLWAGQRPATPTGMPLLGPKGADNLILNTGHGALGFTLALGAAESIARHISGEAGGVDLSNWW
ncbi:D-amino-acid dehydrogenase [Devosia sp. 2618]